jgi:hypothetical protein
LRTAHVLKRWGYPIARIAIRHADFRLERLTGRLSLRRDKSLATNPASGGFASMDGSARSCLQITNVLS